MNRFFAKALMFGCIASAPVALLTLGWSLRLMFDIAPGWIWAAQCASFVVIALGFAALLDNRNPSPPQPRRDR